MRFLLVALLALWAASATAQSTDEDRDYITRLIEDTISNENFTVRLENFEGALSSQATVDAITLADADGIWLRLEGLTLAWNRSALLRGRVDVERLAATRIELIRLPEGGESEDLPDAAATPFSLPELPVSVNIQSVTAAEIILTEALLGEPVAARFDGTLTLGDGAGTARILLERTDAKEGRFDVDAAYDNETRQLALNLQAREGENGIAARLLNLPGGPSVSLAITGDAPLDDFTAQIALATGGVDRVAGTVILARPAGTTDQAFNVDLNGDLRPFLPMEYQDFFGTNTVLKVDGTAFGEGGVSLSNLIVGADKIVLRGSAALDAQGWPEKIDLRGRLASGDGSPVLLPIGGAPTQVSDVALNVTYDAATADAWTGSFDVTALARDGVLIDALALTGGGVIVPAAGDTQGRFSADLRYGARGLTLDDPALTQAIGRDIQGTIDLGRLTGEPFVIRALTLNGAGLSATVRAFIEGSEERFLTRADLSLTADDFTRFAALSGLDLSGGGTVDIDGQIQPFDGIFDVSLNAATRNLALGIEQLDGVLAGDSALSLEVERDTEGTRLRQVRLSADGIAASGSAALTGETATATFNAAIADLATITPELSGPAMLRADVSTDDLGVVSLDSTVTAPSARADIEATATPATEGYVVRGTGAAQLSDLTTYRGLAGQQIAGAVSVDIDAEFITASGELSSEIVAQTQDVSAGIPALDQIIAGLGRISANVTRNDAGRLRLDALDVSFPNLTAQGDVATSGADTTANLSVRLRDVALLLSDFSGPLSADLVARQDATGWQITTDVDGPVNTNARVQGRVNDDGGLDLSINGSAPLALANLYIAPRQINGLARFDLNVQGPPVLNSVSGPIRIENARLAVPNLRLALENLNGALTLGNSSARIDLSGQSADGGTVALSGPLDLTPPFRADLTAALIDVVLRDPTLYRTTARGEVTVSGALTGGAAIAGTINLGTVDVQVPSTGVSALGSLPAVTHLGIPTDVRATLDRAGVGAIPEVRDARSAGPDFPINLLIRAPSRIFVRGRGLDAELGGQLRLSGSTREIQPIGRFDLVRGRLDILGQRFDIDEGFAQLQGDFSPFLRLVATTQTPNGTTVSIVVEGPADDIDVRFESSPELPQDEVLSQLLFGRDLSSISPLQAVQLASAVATLAGRGGGGVVERLRTNLNLDDLDFVTDEDGNAAVRAGAYISERVYTDVTVGAGGTSEINLNIDIDRNFTARGSAATDGETSVGIFFERDY